MSEQGILKKIFIAVIIIVFLLVVLHIPSVRTFGMTAYEDVALMVDPSAARAYEFGNRHFDAVYPNDYDIERAATLFEKAHARDPALPLLQHQRARIAFLKGNFGEALTRINTEIAANPPPSSYYVRGLIKGFAGDYEGAAADYETYLRTDPTNWAAINDYAWVLLKDGRPHDALVALDWGIIFWPDNPWLLNGKAIAHYEIGQLELAAEAAARAEVAVEQVTEADWLQAYPGNDPLIAREGVEALRAAVQENVHTITLAREKTSKDVR